MSDNVLPRSVIKKDHDLEQDYDTIGMQLMEHRWHWTLDVSNPKRVSIRQYAREIGRHHSTVADDANGWAEKVAEDALESVGSRPDTSKKTASDYRKTASLSTERKHAVEALAKATGRSVGQVAQTAREEVTAVVGRARERAERKGTEVAEEIEAIAEWDAKAARAAEKGRQEHKARHSARYIEIEGDLGVAMKRLRKVLNDAENVGFTSDEIDLIGEALGKLRALMNLIDLRIVGSVDIDWDTEFQKIAE